MPATSAGMTVEQRYPKNETLPIAVRQQIRGMRLYNDGANCNTAGQS
jgi:hypothetical protein